MLEAPRSRDNRKKQEAVKPRTGFFRGLVQGRRSHRPRCRGYHGEVYPHRTKLSEGPPSEASRRTTGGILTKTCCKENIYVVGSKGIRSSSSDQSSAKEADNDLIGGPRLTTVTKWDQTLGRRLPLGLSDAPRGKLGHLIGWPPGFPQPCRCSTPLGSTAVGLQPGAYPCSALITPG
ncbi:unnamed protein product [Cuscuta epithymum]|uniref:Uncharacterized protein n=1 Tax=Cuscuta epithymum TaxID=186058 RepID=A0AAV0FKQ9_9ASTE|nr:unnamed protein product [Cuscuta epithymum]